MKIRQFIDQLDSTYIAQLFTEAFTETQRNKMISHGEPEVDVGGHFVGSATRPGDLSPTNVDFTLPSSLRRIATDFPVKQMFDIRDDPTSDVMAVVWAQIVTARLQDAMNTLLALKEPFVGEGITNVP